jgi:hypothetical protein
MGEEFVKTIGVVETGTKKLPAERIGSKTILSTLSYIRQTFALSKNDQKLREN